MSKSVTIDVPVQSAQTLIPPPLPTRPLPLPPPIVEPRIADVEAMARWFDYAFELPGGFRFGFAGLIGLIPGIGDVIDALISLYIVIRAIQLGVSKVAVTRMVVNVGLESLMGSLPFLGDLLIVGYKANKRNYELLRQHLYDSKRQKSKDTAFLIIIGAVLLICLSAPIVALVLLLRHL